MPRNLTLKDVAKRAGVSTATVARVLHSNGYVATETRKRVESALAETRYQLNVVAQGLRKQQSFTIGHSLHTITRNPFFARVALGVEERALREGYGVFIFNAHGDEDRERVGVETFIRRRVDAVIFTTAKSEENVRRVADAGIPLVQVERLTPVPSSVVLIDNYVGALQAMQHLLDLGHERIGFIGGDPSLYPYPSPRKHTVEEERLAAYRDALTGEGIAVQEELIHLGRYFSLEDAGHNGEGYLHMRELLALTAPPSAVFATCDLLAAGALQAIYSAGLRVPDDISVVGFDDTLAVNLTPPLTTVAVPTQDVGRAAGKAAIEAAAGAVAHTTVTLPTSLLVRNSTSHRRT
jgi:LacI family transcriptional regulator